MLLEQVLRILLASVLHNNKQRGELGGIDLRGGKRGKIKDNYSYKENRGVKRSKRCMCIDSFLWFHKNANVGVGSGLSQNCGLYRLSAVWLLGGLHCCAQLTLIANHKSFL